MTLANVHRLQPRDETRRSCGRVAFNAGRCGNVAVYRYERAQRHARTRQDVTDATALADMMLDDAPAPGTDGQSTSSSVIPPVDTHWSRILYYDLFSPDTGSGTPDPDEISNGDLLHPARIAENKPPATPQPTEIFMAATGASQGAGSHRLRSPITAAVILLAIYIAMYLAVAGIVHVLASPDAAAAAALSDRSMAPASPAAASAPAKVGESAISDPLD